MQGRVPVHACAAADRQARKKVQKEGQKLNQFTYPEFDVQELDSKANEYTLRCLRITAFAFFIIWLLTMFGIFIVDRGLMSGVFFVASVVMLAPTAVCRWSGTRDVRIKYVILLFAGLATTLIGSMLTFHAVLLFALPLFYAAQYSDRRMIYYAYAMTVVGVFVSVMVGYYWGICDANMLLLSNDSTIHYAEQIADGQRLTVNANPWITLPLYFVLPRCMILAVFVPVIRKISDNISKNAANAARMRYIGERDKATRFYNRSKYLELIEEYYPTINTIGVIFWDINNLKEVNDTQGHAYGDSMIVSIASCIYELTSETRRVFRLGGDEFVMLLEYASEDEIEDVLDQWSTLVEAERVNSMLPISVAVGKALGAGKDVEALVAQADAKMYQDKRRMKRQIIT